MSETFIVKMPKLGESIVSAKIITWLKKEGDKVEVDEPILEVATDKVNSEIPSPVAGILGKIIAQVDEEYDVDAPLCEILISETSEEPQVVPKQQQVSSSQKGDNAQQQNTFISPAILRLAQENHISLQELEKIKGSGGGQRITKQDLEAYIAEKKAAPQSSSKELAVGQNVERIEMSQMRKAIAENMVKSFYQAPHATLISEVDVSNILRWIQENKEPFFHKYGYKISITSFIASAIAKSIQEFPLINSSLEGNTIVIKRRVNLGIAVSVEQAIMVPVIRFCDKKSIIEIASEVAQLSKKARENQLKPDDVQEGTITMTNFGMGGTKIGIPIIRFPEVAIVGIGAIEKKPKAMDESTIAVRDLVHISLTFDHRALDGMYGCGFLYSLKKHLENNELTFRL